MVTFRNLVRVTAGLCLFLAGACSAQPAPLAAPTLSELDPPPPGLSRVILVGDSVAQGHGLAIGAALGAAGVEFHSMASDGGGTVVGPTADLLWAELPERLRSAKPSTVIYQITSYDWGTEQEQKAAYERLLTTVRGVGAKLVVVTMPPIKPDDFYAAHVDELAHAPKVARKVVGDDAFLDAREVWGESYQRTHEGKVDRSSDGVHTCPQGAARFTVWLLDELAERNPGFTPPQPAKWANIGWAGDRRFVGC